jgi:hypothetical protein
MAAPRKTEIYFKEFDPLGIYDFPEKSNTSVKDKIIFTGQPMYAT